MQHVCIYTVDTSGVNRLASQICHNRLFRKKLQHNLLRIISTEVSFLATHITSPWELSKRSHLTHRVYFLVRLPELRHHIRNIHSHNWVRFLVGLSNGEIAPRDYQLMKHLLFIVARVEYLRHLFCRPDQVSLTNSYVDWYALLRMRHLSISCAEGCVVISCGKVDYDKSGWRGDWRQMCRLYIYLYIYIYMYDW
jgi:hypothetical protein